MTFTLVFKLLNVRYLDGANFQLLVLVYLMDEQSYHDVPPGYSRGPAPYYDDMGDEPFAPNMNGASPIRMLVNPNDGSLYVLSAKQRAQYRLSSMSDIH